jgi:hypothetical protein
LDAPALARDIRGSRPWDWIEDISDLSVMFANLSLNLQMVRQRNLSRTQEGEEDPRSGSYRRNLNSTVPFLEFDGTVNSDV